MSQAPATVVPNRQWPPNGELSGWIIKHFPPGYQGYAVDVGASDGVSVNTTYLLEQERRWTVLCIEPNPLFWEKLKRLRPFVLTCACDSESKPSATFYSFNRNPEAFSALRPTGPRNYPVESRPSEWTELQVPVWTLEQCLTKAHFPRLDALCVDVEGNELDVLKGIDIAKWKPKVMVIEAWQAGQCDEYLKQFGYRRASRNVHNDCFELEEATDGAAPS